MTNNTDYKWSENGFESMYEDFSSLNLSEISPEKKPKKTPKRVLHFSDGTLEEFSTDEEDNSKPETVEPTIDSKTLPWAPWVAYMATKTGKSVLATCDYVGEGIANFLGITSQKYFYEIEEYKRTMKQEEEERNKISSEMAGWTTSSNDVDTMLSTNEPVFQDHFEKSNSKSSTQPEKY